MQSVVQQAHGEIWGVLVLQNRPHWLGSGDRSRTEVSGGPGPGRMGGLHQPLAAGSAGGAGSPAAWLQQVSGGGALCVPVFRLVLHGNGGSLS